MGGHILGLVSELVPEPALGLALALALEPEQVLALAPELVLVLVPEQVLVPDSQ